MTGNFGPQKIYINARFLTQQVTGVQRYAWELVRALDSLVEDGEILRSRYSLELLAPSQGVSSPPALRHINLRKVGRLTGHAWEQLELPFYSRDGFLVSLCNTSPLLKRRQVVTIHDAAVFGFPQAYSFSFRTWYKFLLTGLGLMAARVITVSSFSREELVRFCRIDQNKLQVVQEGKEHILACPPDNTILDRFNLGVRPYVLAVSSMSSNKNFRSVVKAVELLDDGRFDIVIAGGVNPQVFATAEDSLPAKVKYVGYVNDKELRALYENAACFVYPSFYEGFGLPPLEAMACGCPVVASGTSSIPEVCGDAALYCNPNKPSDIAGKIESIMHYIKLRDDLRRKGLARAQEFTWEKCAREAFAVIRQALNKK